MHPGPETGRNVYAFFVKSCLEILKQLFTKKAYTLQPAPRPEFMAGWLAGWLAGWPGWPGWLAGWLAWLACWLAGWLADWLPAGKHVN